MPSHTLAGVGGMSAGRPGRSDCPVSGGSIDPDDAPSRRPIGRKEVNHTANDLRPAKGTLGGSNRLMSAREVTEILAIPERDVRDRWREWGLQAYKAGKHLRWRERDVYARIDRQTA